MLKQRLLALGFSVALATTGAYIGSQEGVSLTPYKDLGGVRTWCYGQTVGPHKASYTLAECDADLMKMVQEYAGSVTPYLPKDAPASVVAAFTSTAVNIGKSGWRGSQFTSGWVPAPYMAALSKGEYKRACDLLEAPWPGKYGTARGYKATIGGYPSKGLGNRRHNDAEMCRSDL